MSHANLYVRFPDGAVRYGIYSGTADVACRELHGSPAAAWDAYEDHQCYTAATLIPWGTVPVDIATDYGNGFAWRGHATRDVLVTGRFPFGMDGAGGAVIEPPADGYTEGLPDWVQDVEGDRG